MKNYISKLFDCVWFQKTFLPSPNPLFLMKCVLKFKKMTTLLKFDEDPASNLRISIFFSQQKNLKKKSFKKKL